MDSTRVKARPESVSPEVIAFAEYSAKLQLELLQIDLDELKQPVLDIGWGSFYYAPALPFIEDRLAPERYKVERQQPAGDLFVSIVTRI